LITKFLLHFGYPHQANVQTTEYIHNKSVYTLCGCTFACLKIDCLSLINTAAFSSQIGLHHEPESIPMMLLFLMAQFL